MIRFAYYGLAGTFLYALMLTSSRGAFVTLIVLVAFMIWDSKRKVLFVGLLAVASVLAWSGLSDFHKDRYLSLISSDTSTASGATADGRIRGMTTEFRLGLKRPIFGHGLGTTPEAKVNQLGGRRQAAHNLYAELLIEIGAIGAIIFLAYLFKLRSAVKDNLLAFKRAVRQGVPVDGFMLNLNKALLVVFWVYAVYSINYFGLSQDYWYIFGGLCIAFARSIKRNREVYFGTESAPLQGAGGAGTKRPLSA
nr:O-antigen ligase family protein [Natronocella acetinitrilica]